MFTFMITLAGIFLYAAKIESVTLNKLKNQLKLEKVRIMTC